MAYTEYVKRLFSYLFIPESRNNHRAAVLHPGFISLFIAIYLLNQSVLKSLTILRPGILGYSSEITTEKVLILTNLERQKYNLPPLSYNATLALSAQAKGEDMFAKDYWAHTSPAPYNQDPWVFFRQAGYEYSIAGENLAKDFYDTESMLSAWMHSPTHKDNIINTKYQEIGIAVINGVLGGVKTTLVVQHFGAPLSGTPALDPLPQNLSVQSAPVLAVANQAKAAEKLISPTQISKIFGLLLFGLIIIVLFVDGYLTLKNNTHRLTGSNTGHIAFLAIILLLLIFSRQGTIF